MCGRPGAGGPIFQCCGRCKRQKNVSVNAQVNVYCPVVCSVPSAISVKGQSQKKDVRPLSETKKERNSVKSVSFVDHCVCAPNVLNVPNVAHVQLVGGRLQNLWQKCPSWVQIKV